MEINTAPRGNFEMEKWSVLPWLMYKIMSGTKMKTVTTLLHWHWCFLPWFFLFLVWVPILLLSSTLFQLQISSQVINFVRKKWDPRIKLCLFWKKNCARLLYGYCFTKVSGLSSHPTPSFYTVFKVKSLHKSLIQLTSQPQLWTFRKSETLWNK